MPDFSFNVRSVPFIASVNRSGAFVILELKSDFFYQKYEIPISEAQEIFQQIAGVLNDNLGEN